MRALAIVLITTGFLLMAVSPLWRPVASSKLFWDDTRAVEFAEAVADLHQAQTEASLENDPLQLNADGMLEEKAAGELNQSDIRAGDDQTRSAGERFYESQRKLANAREFRNKGGSVMRWLGAAAALVGLGIYQWQKSRTADRPK